MTPKEIFELDPIRSADTYFLEGHFSDALGVWDHDWLESLRRITVDIVADYVCEYHRSWTLSCVRLDGEPVMILQAAGRGGDDYREEYVVDGAKHKELEDLLRESVDKPGPHVVGMNEDYSYFTSFYGENMEAHMRGKTGV